MKRTTWSWEDVRKEGIKNRFFDYTETAHMNSVLYNGVFVNLTFLKKNEGEGFLIVSSKAEHYQKAGNVWIETFYKVWKPTKNQGNSLYRALKATEKISKSGLKYFNLARVRIEDIEIDYARELKDCGRLYEN